MLNTSTQLEINKIIPRHNNKIKFYDFVYNSNNYNTTNVSYTNIYEDNEAKYINILAPGENKDTVNIFWEDEYLNLTSKTKNKEKNNYVYLMREFNLESLYKSLKIESSKYNISAIEAKIEDGVIYIMVPKLVKDKLKIEVKPN